MTTMGYWVWEVMMRMRDDDHEVEEDAIKMEEVRPDDQRGLELEKDEPGEDDDE